MSTFDPEKITFFAKTDTRGQQLPFGVKAQDRQRHMYVIGKTGMGKSTLLENMAAQDILSGEGMAFIDPHGSAIEALLDYIPEDRLDDVVYFAPFDMENPIAFNIMEDVGVDKRHLVVSGLMSTFKKIWVDAWSARMEYILTNALLALIEYPDTTLLSVNRMLADKVYRDKVVAHIKDPAVKAYWVDEFASYTERFAAEALPAIQNKIGQFTGNPLIRNIIGQPHSSFDVRKMMDERKILLINLSKGLVGETNADLIGSMLITKIYLAAMSRADQTPAQMKLMPNFYFYVDEFQSFANATFANILSEARKYHLNLIIAHQYVAQMEDEIRDAVFGNVGTTVAFRTGPFDAEVLETVFAPQFEAVDLVNLGMYQVCLTLMIDGVGSTPFSATTLPPVKTPTTSHKHMAIKRSQQNYCKPRAEVEQAVIDSHSPEKRIEEAVENGAANKGGFTKPSAFFKVGTDKKPAKKKPQIGAGGDSDNRGNGNTASTATENSPAKRPVEPVVAAESTTKTEPIKSVRDEESRTQTKQAEQTKRPERPEKTERPKQKPRPSAKTADDLRAILTRMTADSKPAEKPTVPERRPDRPERVTPDTRRRPEVTPEKKPQPSQRQPREDTPRHANKPITQNQVVEFKKDDLKSALAALITPAAGQSAAPSPRQLRDQVQSEATPKNSQPNQSDRPQRREAAQSETVVKKVVRTETLVSQSEKETVPVVVSERRHNAGHQPLQSSTPQLPPNSTGTQAVAVAEEVKQSPDSSIGGVRQPAFAPVAYEHSPDVTTVKQMLRTSGKERPPGMG